MSGLPNLSPIRLAVVAILAILAVGLLAVPSRSAGASVLPVPVAAPPNCSTPETNTIRGKLVEFDQCITRLFTHNSVEGLLPSAGSLRVSLRYKFPPSWPGKDRRNGREGFFDTPPGPVTSSPNYRPGRLRFFRGGRGHRNTVRLPHGYGTVTV